MDTLIKFAFQLGMQYRIYIPLVDAVLSKHRLTIPPYEQMVLNIRSGKFTEELDVSNLQTTGLGAENSRKRMNARRARELAQRDQQQQSPSVDAAGKGRSATAAIEDIRRAWLHPGARRISTEDWLEWLRKFNVDLIKDSPALALRSCYHIANASNTVARDLFNPAFLTHWNELTTEQQKVRTCFVK